MTEAQIRFETCPDCGRRIRVKSNGRFDLHNLGRETALRVRCPNSAGASGLRSVTNTHPESKR
jgi:hypothetical protein